MLLRRGDAALLRGGRARPVVQVRAPDEGQLQLEHGEIDAALPCAHERGSRLRHLLLRARRERQLLHHLRKLRAGGRPCGARWVDGCSLRGRAGAARPADSWAVDQPSRALIVAAWGRHAPRRRCRALRDRTSAPSEPSRRRSRAWRGQHRAPTLRLSTPSPGRGSSKPPRTARPSPAVVAPASRGRARVRCVCATHVVQPTLHVTSGCQCAQRPPSPRSLLLAHVHARPHHLVH